MNKYSRFLTLTYDDEHLPYFVNEDTGEVVATVSKLDIQDFHKDLWNAGFKFRFMVCSEYGSRTLRPHYHGVYFSDQRIPYLDYWKKGVNCKDLPAKESSFKYILKYTLKGSVVPDGAEPNFRTMSRRPGIGSEFVYKGEPYILDRGGVKLVPGHYYRRKYLNSLNEKCRELCKNLTMDYLISTDPDDKLRSIYEENGVQMDFDSWKKQLYDQDYKKQVKINKK